MAIISALRRLLDRRVDLMVVDGDPGVRIIALTWQGDSTGRGVERTLPIDSNDNDLLRILDEIEAALPVS